MVVAAIAAYLITQSRKANPGPRLPGELAPTRPSQLPPIDPQNPREERHHPAEGVAVRHPAHWLDPAVEREDGAGRLPAGATYF